MREAHRYIFRLIDSWLISSALAFLRFHFAFQPDCKHIRGIYSMALSSEKALFSKYNFLYKWAFWRTIERLGPMLMSSFDFPSVATILCTPFLTLQAWAEMKVKEWQKKKKKENNVLSCLEKDTGVWTFCRVFIMPVHPLALPRGFLMGFSILRLSICSYYEVSDIQITVDLSDCLAS